MSMTSGDAIGAVCDDGSCPVARAVRSLDGKWTLLIVRDLLGGRRRFGELRASLVGISPKTLTDRLRDLTDNRLVERTMYAEIPPRVEFSLTEAGRSVAPVIAALAAFGATLPA
jgi:DNA-binding HxlR family transcriptional regulator